MFVINNIYYLFKIYRNIYKNIDKLLIWAPLMLFKDKKIIFYLQNTEYIWSIFEKKILMDWYLFNFLN